MTQQPNLPFVEWDDDAPHQIRLILAHYEDRPGSMYNSVSCTCLRREVGSKAGSYEPMVEGKNLTVEQAKKVFNDPDNHQENKGEVFRTPISERTTFG